MLKCWTTKLAGPVQKYFVKQQKGAVDQKLVSNYSNALSFIKAITAPEMLIF